MKGVFIMLSVIVSLYFTLVFKLIGLIFRGLWFIFKQPFRFMYWALGFRPIRLAAVFPVLIVAILFSSACSTVDTVVEEEPVEVVYVLEPVLLSCVVCEEYKVEDEHCYDWQASMIERLDRERAEREAAADAEAEARQAADAERLIAWNALSEYEQDALMAQARAEVEQWWEDLVQEHHETMIADGWTLFLRGETVPRDHGGSVSFGSSDYWVQLDDNGYLSQEGSWGRRVVMGGVTMSVQTHDAIGWHWETSPEPGIVTFGYGGDFDNFVYPAEPFESKWRVLAAPIYWTICITDRIWVAECECIMPPDWE